MPLRVSVAPRDIDSTVAANESHVLVGQENRSLVVAVQSLSGA